MKQPGVIDHYYSVQQAKILLGLLKDHTAETLQPDIQHSDIQAINDALSKLRQELANYVEIDDGLGFLVPSRDDNGLI